MLFKIAYAILWPIFHLLFPYKIIGKEKLNAHSSGFVVCSNHISFLDPVYLAYTFKRKRRLFFMAKQEIFKNRLFTWFIKGVGGFPVNRDGGTSGIKAAEALLKEGKNLCIFPEGTRSKDGKIGKGKAGAAMLVREFDSYVLPITLACKNQKVRAFRKVTIIIGDAIQMPPCSAEMSQREHLRVCTAAIMTPIQEGLSQYEQQA